jgi:hypothetical protein
MNPRLVDLKSALRSHHEEIARRWRNSFEHRARSQAGRRLAEKVLALREWPSRTTTVEAKSARISSGCGTQVTAAIEKLPRGGPAQ